MIGTRPVLLLLVLAGCASTQEPQRLASPHWPRSYQDSGDKVVVYEPQVEGEWTDHRKLHARSAIVVTPKGGKQDAYGVMEYDVDTEVNVDTREVLFKNRRIADLRFPGMSKDAVEKASEIVTRLLTPEQEIIVPLDFVLAYLQDQAKKARSVTVNLDPPPIYTSESPAILVIFMGEPTFKPVPGLNLQFATNTNWDVFRDPSTSRYYLLNGQGWIMTKDLEQGPWETASSIPSDLGKLPADPCGGAGCGHWKAGVAI